MQSYHRRRRFSHVHLTPDQKGGKNIKKYKRNLLQFM